ncbi:hypothetical protein CW304_19140 [Bacillus sp. UFRGS-B20]|nr:hypothetical protein CW304_19140 [Bacillus sp. UFRGS-B20]
MILGNKMRKKSRDIRYNITAIISKRNKPNLIRNQESQKNRIAKYHIRQACSFTWKFVSEQYSNNRTNRSLSRISYRAIYLLWFFGNTKKLRVHAIPNFCLR